MKKVKIKTFLKKNTDKYQYKIVLDLAKKIKNFMNKKEVNERIQNANSKGTHSKKIQDIIMEFAISLGFKNEKEELFLKYKNSKLRPDFYKKLDKGGILIEVEKGKTITNNMDLLDVWKCHICEEANHLFLIVPIEVTHTKNVFNIVCNRTSSFFKEQNYINIDSVTVFGY